MFSVTIIIISYYCSRTLVSWSSRSVCLCPPELIILYVFFGVVILALVIALVYVLVRCVLSP